MQLTMEELRQAMEAEGYICDDDLVVTTYLALRMGKPMLICGAPGVGKTEVAKVLSRVLHTELIRLQCYEGLDENKALYEWNYQRQLLKIQMARDVDAAHLEQDIFSREYLLERPLLKAIQAEKRPVLLIDEIDKTDEEFEAFLFEVLSDFQVSVPELGTITARQVPVVVLTSNGERELSDGLKRRCIFLFIDYPPVEKEVRIIRSRVPEAGPRLARQVAGAVAFIRANLELKKQPAIAETLDWARALVVLGAERVTPDLVQKTLNLILKDREDTQLFHRQMGADRLAGAACAGEA